MNLVKMKKSYEEMLFRYGISCAENLVFLGTISPTDYNKLVSYSRRKDIPDREFLERVFSVAVTRIGEKTPEAVDEYFRRRHNQLIDRREGNYTKMPGVLCELCKVREGEIIGIDDSKKVPFPVYRVRYQDGEDIAFGKYFNDFNVGDRIVVHNKSVVRKL